MVFPGLLISNPEVRTLGNCIFTASVSEPKKA